MSTDILAVARQQRAALERQDAAVIKRLVAAYTDLYGRLRDKIDLLAADLAGMDSPTRGQVAELARYRALIAQVQTELRRYAAFAGTEMGTAAGAAIGQAGRDARALVAAANPGIAGRFDVLPNDAIRSLLGFLDPDGPLFDRLEKLAPFTASKVADTILEKVALGLNPRQWAGAIADQLGGSLTDALRMARTVQLYSYRESSRANYAANADVVRGWYWMAELDPDTCLSCVAQHGSLHDVDEVLNDHHNGRCAMLPAVVGADSPLTQSGQEWFDGLPVGQQADMMGAERHDAYRAGQFEFSALSGTRVDPVYGEMRVEESLQSLVAG